MSKNDFDYVDELINLYYKEQSDEKRKKIKHEIFSKLVPIVYKILRKIQHKYKVSEEEINDLFAESYILFEKCLNKYNPNLGVKFATYFYKTLSIELKFILFNMRNVINLKFVKTSGKLIRKIKELLEKNKSDDEILKILEDEGYIKNGITKEKVKIILNYIKNPICYIDSLTPTAYSLYYTKNFIEYEIYNENYLIEDFIKSKVAELFQKYEEYLLNYIDIVKTLKELYDNNVSLEEIINTLKNELNDKNEKEILIEMSKDLYKFFDEISLFEQVNS